MVIELSGVQFGLKSHERAAQDRFEIPCNTSPFKNVLHHFNVNSKF